MTAQIRRHAAAALGVISLAAVAVPAAQASASTPTNAVKTRAAVPWSSVGNGWLAANSLKNGTNALVLVSPGGQAYTITSLAMTEDVTAVSHDGRHVIVVGRSTKPRVIDMTTGRTSATLPSGRSYTFTRPAGTAIMGFDNQGNYTRYTTTGVVKNTSRLPGLTGLSMNPSGKTVAAVLATKAGQNRIAIRNYSNLSAVRTLPLPAGYSSCWTNGWASPTTLTTTCTNGKMVQVFSQNMNGAAPVPMTSGSEPGTPAADAAGWTDAVATPVGRIAIASRKTIPDFPTAVWKFNGTKANTRIPMPTFNANGGDFANSKTVVDVYGSKVLIASTMLGYTSTNQSIGQYDLVTKKLNYLIGHNSQFGGAPGGFAMIDPRN